MTEQQGQQNYGPSKHNIPPGPGAYPGPGAANDYPGRTDRTSTVPPPPPDTARSSNSNIFGGNAARRYLLLGTALLAGFGACAMTGRAVANTVSAILESVDILTDRVLVSGYWRYYAHVQPARVAQVEHERDALVKQSKPQ